MDGRRLGWQGMNTEMIRTHGRNMIDALDKAIVAGRTPATGLPVFETMRSYTGGMITEFFLGPHASDVAEAVDLRSSIAVKFMASNLTFPKWFPHPGVRAAVAANHRLDHALGDHVRRRRGFRTSEPRDLLDLLLAERCAALTDAQLVQLLRVSLLASYGSPGAALAWTIKEMADRPELTSQVASEAVAAQTQIGGALEPSRLPFTSAFIKEVLRLHPPTWLMGREVARPCELAGWSLRPGQAVMFSPYLVQRDPRWWDDPEDFVPARWLNENQSRTGSAYFPFGAGPRVCLGAQLGTYQLVTATAHLAANYGIEITTPATHTAPGALLLPAGLRARFNQSATRYAGGQVEAEISRPASSRNHALDVSAVTTRNCPYSHLQK
jgi:unspecific monooxygenase